MNPSPISVPPRSSAVHCSAACLDCAHCLHEDAPVNRINLFPAPETDTITPASTGTDASIPARPFESEPDSGHRPDATSGHRPDATPRLQHLTVGAERLPLVLRARELRRAGQTQRDIAAALDLSPAKVNRLLKRVEHLADDEIAAADLALETYRIPGRPRTLALTPAETAAIKANKLLNNRTAASGSLPEAVRQTIKEGGLRPEVVAALQAREAAGRAIVPLATARDLYISPGTTRAFRNPREAWLDFCEQPGSLHLLRDAVTGELRPIEPGECCTADDGTKNFVCTVPLQRPGDKCYEKYGVVVGRWQFLLEVDHRSYFIKGFSHTARPKGSYRAEDLQALFDISFRQHGRPRLVFLEKGISKSNLLHETFDRLDVAYQHVSSPHQKVVEFVFNTLWSKLSFLPGQVGRTRGEEAAVDALVESCRCGATDPRQHFLPLATVLKALQEVIHDWNLHRVNSPQYGSWVPADWFHAAAPQHLRRLDPDTAWIFAPVIADNGGSGYLVRKQNVTLSVPVMPGYSWQFDYAAPWFCEFYGARVKFHFNPFAPEAVAKVVLVEDFQGHRAGEILGDAEQINMNTRHQRRALGIAELEDVALVTRKMSAQALHRSAVAIRPDGKPGLQNHEHRDGLGNTTTLATTAQPGSSAAAAPRPIQQRRQTLARLQDEALDALANLTD